MDGATIEALVDAAGVRRYGLFANRPQRINPLDEFTGVKRRLKWLRLKEWVGFTFVHPEVAASVVVQDAHYLASSELYVADRGTGRLTQHARNARGGSVGLPEVLSGSRCGLRGRGYTVDYEFGPTSGTHRIRIDVEATAKAAAIRGELELDGAAAAPPLSVSSRLPGGAMYTHKVLYPASGTLRVGDTEYVFDATRDLAILDEHHSFFPYRTTWTWGTFAGLTQKGPVGANFCRRPELPGEPVESCLWTPLTVEPLADVSFDGDIASAPWHVAAADGRLDVTFTPDGRKTVKHQLGLAAIDYVQVYGSYRGVLNAAGRTYDITGAHGVWERMDTRF